MAFHSISLHCIHFVLSACVSCQITTVVKDPVQQHSGEQNVEDKEAKDDREDKEGKEDSEVVAVEDEQEESDQTTEVLEDLDEEVMQEVDKIDSSAEEEEEEGRRTFGSSSSSALAEKPDKVVRPYLCMHKSSNPRGMLFRCIFVLLTFGRRCTLYEPYGWYASRCVMRMLKRLSRLSDYVFAVCVVHCCKHARLISAEVSLAKRARKGAKEARANSM